MLSRQWAFSNKSQWVENNSSQWEGYDETTATIWVACKRCYYYIASKMNYFWTSRRKKSGRGRT